MAKRYLVWYLPETTRDGTRQGPTFYVDEDSEMLGLRVYAGLAPDTTNMTFDIKADDTSILDGYASLTKGEYESDLAGDFVNGAVIEAGSWVSLDMVDNGGAKEITVTLELESFEE